MIGDAPFAAWQKVATPMRIGCLRQRRFNSGENVDTLSFFKIGVEMVRLNGRVVNDNYVY